MFDFTVGSLVNVGDVQRFNSVLFYNMRKLS